MMISDDERREVARRIREKGSISYYSDVFKLVMGHEPPFGTSAREDDESLAERLSDLIEPEPERTCRMEYDMAHEGYVCTACGEAFYLDAYMMPNPNGVPVYKLFRHCPQCGALILGVKLVDE